MGQPGKNCLHGEKSSYQGEISPVLRWDVTWVGWIHSHINDMFKIVILNTKWKDCKSRKNLCTKKNYVHEIAAVNLSKICFLKNAKKTCKPNNCDLITNEKDVLLYNDSCFHEDKSNFTVEATTTCTKNFERFSGSIFALCFYDNGKCPYLNHLNQLFSSIFASILIFQWRLRILSSGFCCMYFFAFISYVHNLIGQKRYYYFYSYA